MKLQQHHFIINWTQGRLFIPIQWPKLFGVNEQMLIHSKIRHDLPWRLCPQARSEVVALLHLCRHMSLCSHCERKVLANGEHTNGCLCSEKLVWWCCSLFLGQCVGTIALLKSELSPMNLWTQTCTHYVWGFAEIQTMFALFHSIHPAHSISVSLVKHTLLRRSMCFTHCF